MMMIREVDSHWSLIRHIDWHKALEKFPELISSRIIGKLGLKRPLEVYSNQV